MTNRFAGEKALASTERLMAIAADLEMSPVTLAIAWSKQHDFVASTIVGATHEDQLPEIFAASNIELDKPTMRAIKGVSRDIRYPMG